MASSVVCHRCSKVLRRLRPSARAGIRQVLRFAGLDMRQARQMRPRSRARVSGRFYTFSVTLTGRGLNAWRASRSKIASTRSQPVRIRIACRAPGASDHQRRAVTIDPDNDKNPVIALREIADKTVPPDDLREGLIHSIQKNVEVDEPEAAAAPTLPRTAVRPRPRRPSQRSRRRRDHRRAAAARHGKPDADRAVVQRRLRRRRRSGRRLTAAGRRAGRLVTASCALLKPA